MDTDWLQSKQVALTGRLACMTRDEAAELVRSHGGKLVGLVNRQTAVLVVGQEGWPLRKDGRLSKNLLKAQGLQRAGHSIAILTEDEFLMKLGLGSCSEGISRRYSTAELTRILKVSRDQLRAWMNSGLIHPVETRHGICYFDFRQVAGAKNLLAMTQAGVNVQRISRSLRKLQTLMKTAELPLTQMAAMEKNGEIAARLEDGHLVDSAGQMLFDFDADAPMGSGQVPQTDVGTDWFEVGCEHEDAGRLAEAADAYRQSLALGCPHAQARFNLANVLVALGQLELAAHQYELAVEIDANFAEAWNNLGNVLTEKGQTAKAIAAFKTALELSPLYADAHYNLADLLDQLGRRHEACAHWQAYVRQDPQSQWGSYARRRLKEARHG